MSRRLGLDHSSHLLLWVIWLSSLVLLAPQSLPCLSAEMRCKGRKLCLTVWVSSQGLEVLLLASRSSALSWLGEELLHACALLAVIRFQAVGRPQPSHSLPLGSPLLARGMLLPLEVYSLCVFGASQFLRVLKAKILLFHRCIFSA